MIGGRALPAGVISFVFTDIEGSTRLLRELGDRYDEVFELHHQALRSVWEANAGQEVDSEGDAFFVVFEEASDAVAACVAAQRALGATTWPTELPVRVRIGVHTGYARPAGDDYRALAVNQAARIVDAAHGGQVLVSGDTVGRLGAPLDGVRLQRLGRFRVRDFDDPVDLFSASAAELPERATAPRVRPADGHNLVRPATSLVGRDRDLAVVGELTRPGRATTIVGSGGVGKTRLVVEAALRISGAWDDGAWFVDLSPLTSPEVIPAAIADAIGARSVPGAEVWSEVCDHLRERHALVILDNCEHLVEAVGTAVAELLERCPGVGVLATSRIPLGLRAERVYRLEPLPVGARDAPAVRLFLDRAALTAAHDREAVADLCAELDGLPLAIELAAARTTVLTPREIVERLRRSASVIHSRDPTLPDRQRTLDRLLDWSYDLLEPGARTALRRLTAFAGSFDLETAEQVCAGGDLEAPDVPELLWSLVDSSLVVTEAAAGATRYRLLTTVRAYATRRTGADERASAIGRLSRLYLDRLGPSRATGRNWVGEMALELDNVREVAAHVADDGVAQALAWSIGRYHDVTDAFRAGIEELARWTELFPTPGPNRVALLTLLADLHLRVAELDRAQAVLEQASRLCDAVGAPEWDDSGLARTRGELALRRGDAAGAVAEAERALAAPHSPRGQARLFNLLGIALGTLGDVRGAASAFERELAAASEAGMETFLATTYGNLAEAHLQLGDEVAAARHQETCLELAREQRQPVLIAFSMMIAARLVARRGVPWQAVVLQAAADGLLEKASYALYDEDVNVRAALLASARAALGGQRHRRAAAEGRALDPEAAADLAAAVLREVGSREPDQETVR
jgi:predicted ATPase/class 3 adenylate cyclase